MGIIDRNRWFRDSKNVPDFFSQGAARDGADPTNTAMFCSYLCLNPSSLHWASELSDTCCPVGRNRHWIPCHVFSLRLSCTCLDPLWFPSFFFFFSLPLSLLSPLNPVAGFGRKNKSFCCNEERMSFISIHKYILLLLFAFLFLSPGHYALIFNSVKSGGQREMHTIIKISAPLYPTYLIFSFRQ